MKAIPLGLLGKAMLAAGAFCCVIGMWIGWAAVQRWCAVSALRSAQAAQAEGKTTLAREAATEAAGHLAVAAPVLYAADLTQAATLDRLARLAVDAAADDRATVLAAVALGHALRREEFSGVEGTGDGRLLAALTAVEAGRGPGALSAPGEAPPHQAVALLVYTRLLRHAWEEGDARQVRRIGGALLLISPHTPEMRVVACVTAATEPDASDDEVTRMADMVPDAVRERAAVAIMNLVPARRAALAKSCPKLREPTP